MYLLYVLKLNNDKYYVGITSDFQSRYYQHEGSLPGGSIWVRKYGIQNVEAIYKLDTNNQATAQQHEDYYTIRYIKKYGLANVRGGRFVSRHISDTKFSRLANRVSTAP